MLRLRARALLLAGVVAGLLWADAAEPRRIVSLSPAITETLFALGVGDRVVGVTRFCNFPPEARRRRTVGGLTDVDVEAVLALRPDLVVAHSQQAVVPRLRSLGLEVLTVRAQTVGEVLSMLETIGRRVGREAEARALVARIRGEMTRVAEAVKDLRRPRVLLVLGRAPLVAAGRGSFLDELITAAGGENILGDSHRPYPLVSMETVLLRRPEVIIECSGSMADEDLTEQARRAWARWKDLPAVRDGRIYISRSDALLRPGPRVVEGLHELVRLLHPEVARSLTEKDDKPQPFDR